MRSFAVGVSIAISADESGVSPSDLPLLATRLEALGVEALFVSADADLEPITALAAIAPVCDLVLGAVLPLASGRLPTIVAKRATTLALLADDRVALVFRDDQADNQVALIEAVKTASLMGESGPLDFIGSTVRLVGAFNEPRPDQPARLGVGAWTTSPTQMLAAECDLLVLDAGTTAEFAGEVFTITAHTTTSPTGGERAPGAEIYEIAGGDVERICEIASRAVGSTPR